MNNDKDEQQLLSLTQSFNALKASISYYPEVPIYVGLTVDWIKQEYIRLSQIAQQETLLVEADWESEALAWDETDDAFIRRIEYLDQLADQELKG